jgi:hypothetical protein
MLIFWNPSSYSFFVLLNSHSYTDPAEITPASALSNLIDLYAADNEHEKLRREQLSDEVWNRYFYNEARDPVLREMEQDRVIGRAKMAREQQRANPDLAILADVSAMPPQISKPLLERIKYFHSLDKPKAYSRYLRETIRPCLARLERVRDSQISASFRFMASHDGLTNSTTSQAHTAIMASAFMESGPRWLRAGFVRTRLSGKWFVKPLTFRRRQPTRALAPLGLVAITVPLLKI